MTRSEVAERAGVGPQTVLYYESRQLLPSPRRTPAGYRLYTDRHVRCIQFLRHVQALGFSLEDASALAELQLQPSSGPDQLRCRRQMWLDRIDARLRDLKELRAGIERL